MSATLKTASGFAISYPSGYSTSTKQNDIGIGDHTTYDPSMRQNQQQSVWDLGAANAVSDFYASVFYVNAAILYFEYSDDGTSWTTGLTGSVTLPDHAGVGSWEDLHIIAVVATSHQYWKLTLLDPDVVTGVSSELSSQFLLMGG